MKSRTAKPATKGRVVAAADACDEGVGRLDVVLCMLRAFHENERAEELDSEYKFQIVEELLMDIRDRLARGSAEYEKWFAAGEGGAR